MFHMIPFTSTEVEVVGKSLNCGGRYRFCRQGNILQWLAKKLEMVKKELECKIFKCLRKIT